MWDTACKYFSNNEVISICLQTLDKDRQNLRWGNFDPSRHISIVNGNGISIYFTYGYSWLEAQLTDESFNSSFDKRSKRWRNLKEEGILRLSICVTQRAYYPHYSPKCLTRLLKVLKKEFGGYEIEGKKILGYEIKAKTIYIIKTNTPGNIVLSYLKLCDILYNERIKCHNDIKKYLYDTGKITEYKLIKGPIDMYNINDPFNTLYF